MASWKKVIVSGSNAELAQITASGDIKVAGIVDDALTAGRVTFAGANKQLTDDSDLTFDGNTLSAKQIVNASAVADSRLTGSFTGSFKGTFTNSDGTALEAEWDGTRDGNSQITGSGTGTTLVLSGSTGTDLDVSLNATIGGTLDVSGAITSDGEISGSTLSTNLESGQVVFAGVNGVLSDDSTLTFNSTTKIFGAQHIASRITSSNLTNTRVTFAGANGELVDDGDLTFDGNTLSAKQIVNASAVADSRLTGSFTGSFAGDGTNLDLSTNTTLPATDWDGTLNVGDVTGLAAASITGSLIVSSSDGGDGGIVTAKSFDVLSAGNVTLFGNVGDAELTVGASSTTVKLIGDVIELGNGSGDRVEVAGNLNVAGTASFNHSENLSVVDKYILLNSGSNGVNLDSGGIVIGGPNDNGKGELFGFISGSSVDSDGKNRRWAIAADFNADTAGDFTPEAFMSTVTLSSVESSQDPDNVSDKYKKAGNIFIDQTDGIPYIYV